MMHSLDAVFAELRSRSDATRQAAAARLAEQVAASHRELQTAEFNRFYDDVHRRIHTLVTASDTAERTGGLYALSALVDFRGDDAALKVAKYSSYVKRTLDGSDPVAMVAAARCLGRLAAPGGPFTAELVDAEVKHALELLTATERNETRRFAAVLVLRELARNNGTLLFHAAPTIMMALWEGLRDTKPTIRETSAELLGLMLGILAARDQQTRQVCITRTFDTAVDAFRRGTAESVHGALLAFREMLMHGGMLMHGTRYQDICGLALKPHMRDHRDPAVRRGVVELLPVLAGYAPNEFCRFYLDRSMQLLLTLLKDTKQRNLAFTAIGKIANAVGSAIAPYLDTILLHIRQALSPKPRGKDPDDAPVFECISMVSIAVGQTLSKYMEALLDPIFACGLSDALTQALVDMAHYIPSIRPSIQEKLLDLLSRVLCGRSFASLGHPTLSQNLPPIFTKEIREQRDPQHQEQKTQEIALALHTLGSFDFTGHIMNEFVRDVAIRYVEDDDPAIRKAAALTCCQLVVRDPIVHQTSYHAIRVIGDIIEKLLTVGVADTRPEIRQTVLSSLDARFDRHLAKAENIRSLFLALNDENFAIREAAIAIIGRLTNVNPAYVFPSLRKVLIQLLTEIQYSNNANDKREAAELIGHLVGASTKLIKPYVSSMVNVLLPKADDINADVAAATLKTLGQLATVGGDVMMESKSSIEELMNIIMRSLLDLSSNKKREAALCTLGQLASNAGYVIKPYEDHPQLLNILINIVKTEPPGDMRRETIRLLGILGALDPYRHQEIMEESPDNNLRAEAEAESDVSLIMRGMPPSNEEYYPTIVINTLMAIPRDDTLKQYHSAVVDAVMNIYATMGMKCVQFLHIVVPGIVSILNEAQSDERREAYFNNLSVLVKIVKQHIRPHLQLILRAVSQNWNTSTRLQATILSLIESIARSLEGEFKIYLADVLPLLLGVLEDESKIESSRAACQRVLHAFLVFGSSAEEYTHLILPVIVRLFDTGRPRNRELRKLAIETVGRLSKQVNISEFAAQIVHPITRVLQGTEPSLKQPAMDTLCALVYQLGLDYLRFVPTIDKVLQQQKIQHVGYANIVSKLKRNEPLSQNLSPEERYRDEDDDPYPAEISTKKLAVNQQHLKNAWEASQKSTKEDWQEWMRRFSVELLKESPQHALRACTPLASVYPPLARTLFNSAFASCWTELYDQYQDELVRSLEVAITSPSIPPEILQVLLTLAEFMEHDDKALPIDVRTLGMYAAKCHAFAKALHYKELEFNAEQNASAVEALISINNQLQQTDAAFGILRKARGYRDVELKETWFEKLQRWDDALQAYQKREKEAGDNVGLEITMGKMRCLHALGEWDTLSNIAQDRWLNTSSDHHKAIAPLAAAAAWGMGQWDVMDTYLNAMKPASPDRSFFGAILAIHWNQFDQANQHIAKARDGLDTELGALLGESYTRAYSVIVRVQMLAELEEIITYKKHEHDPEKQAQIRSTWTKRLSGCQRNVEDWQRVLKVRALVITPQENSEMYMKFASICRKSHRPGLAEKSLNSLLGDGGHITSPDSADKIKAAPYPVQYAIYKFLWSNGQADVALESLKEFTQQLRSDYEDRAESLASQQQPGKTNGINGINGVNGISGINGVSSLAPFGPAHSPVSSAEWDELEKWRKLLARCYLKQGEWMTKKLDGEWDSSDLVQDILQSYYAATRFNEEWYKAWHAWALANFEVVNSMASKGEGEEVPQQLVAAHVVPAIKGFFKSIALSSMSSLQDTLRLLTLWFAHGKYRDVNYCVTQGLSSVSIDTWLEVIPQLIARINQPHRMVRDTINQLLVEVGRAHPQALIYPLTVSMKSEAGNRSRASKNIMEAMRQHSPHLVEQADMVSHELIRIAVLWHELWHEALEEASRLYFGDHNIQGMLDTLTPLHDLLDRGPETLREISFLQSFGRDLREARDWCRAYRNSKEIGDLNQAWDLYYGVFKRIARQLPQLMSLELQYVSPQLKEAHDLKLAVPGTYQSGKPVVRIQSFDPVASVISSKQRPRKLSIRGSDGVRYDYALKGHEDIRQDERVMQLFGLVNTLLATDPECLKRHLNIQRYAAIPLSTQSGLLGWVPNSDTLHVLIREYRETRKILLNIEHRIMVQMAPDYDHLTLMQKVEVFGYALDNTTGQDLYRVLWLKSKSSEAWLDRRTNYTRSLAVMSMVGYILGLGDRHPSNLMLDRVTGKVIHIDFGDCFEVAMHREKYPERVPFRLTRMLTFAMEVSNIEGSFRTTCEYTMSLLRSNKDSLIAVLEAFIHDPLMNWRLNVPKNGPEPGDPAPPQAVLEPAAANRRPSVMGAVDAEPLVGAPTTTAGGSLRVGGKHPTTNNIEEGEREVQNARAVQVLERVKEKLSGRDFVKKDAVQGGKKILAKKPGEGVKRGRGEKVRSTPEGEGGEEEEEDEGSSELDVEEQVEQLIVEATNLENLCQHYIGIKVPWGIM
ncbi:TOR1 phosphatidylinositol 3-kinase [Piedraia hortae CBS 480.64]|uniref:Serine/threonine-protein kinase TOR n=1 Tax=Piedraia hortae CBS 480.64 TaxID=1314780 RepID=A0A6A7BY47_9PEZI|nr:TOR1 phosphatidylinositol 3-kinase [Piedraia hortae CBS 480.64]